MTPQKKFNPCALAFAAAGAAAALLYRAVFAGNLDARELLIRGSIPEIVLWVLTAAAIGAAIFLGRKFCVLDGGRIVGALGNAVYAAGVASLLMEEGVGPAPLVLFYRIMVIAAAASLAVTVVMQLLGKTPWFLLTVAPCLLAMLHVVECYQIWSEVPLFLDYAFGVGATLCLMLFSFNRLTKAANMPVKGLYTFSGLLGVFFCCVAAAAGDFVPFFAAAGVWMLAGTICLGTPAAEE